MRRHLGELIALLVGLILWLVGVLYQGVPAAGDTRAWFRVLSNGALLPAVIFLGVSGLTWIAGNGLFEGVKYSLGNMLRHILGTPKPYATYYDYIRRPRRHGTSYPLLLPGLFLMAAAVVLTLLCGMV